MIVADYSEIFQPLVESFTQSKVQTILMAWLPIKLEPYMSGIMAVDMFIVSILSTGLTALALASYTFLYPLMMKDSLKRKGGFITIRIEHQAPGSFGPHASTFYEALSWMISRQTKPLENGSFVMQHTNTVVNDPECPPDFNILPERGQQISIEYRGKRFDVKFESDEPNQNRNMNHDNNGNNSQNATIKRPSIYLTTVESTNANVDYASEFLNEVARAHMEHKKRMRKRCRYELDGIEGYWYSVQALSTIRGLDTVALDESQESLLMKELETFVKDKDFYERIGMPYRRGILLYGKPGTGKTSLINAISAQLSRDIYYLNLQNVQDDNGLNVAFSSVPPNQIIALEDVDTQSKVLHRRKDPLSSTPVKRHDKDSEKSSDLSSFSLSTFLGCLDGHILSEGNIIIMTTNHVEHLDPACVRPGRMDVHLDLGYCTHYQIQKMYKSVIESPEAEFPQDILEGIPEGLLPPCEVMTTMVLYRNEIELIPQKFYELVAKCENMKSEDMINQKEEETYVETEFTDFLYNGSCEYQKKNSWLDE